MQEFPLMGVSGLRITLGQIQHFFGHYKDLEPGKWVQVGDWMDAEAAKGLIGEAIERAKS